MVHNGHNGFNDGPLANNLLIYPAARAALVKNLVVLAKQRGWAGYVFDFENLSPAALRAYPAMLAEARAALKPIGREVWVSTPFGDNDWNLKLFQSVADTVVLMAYDQHWGGGDPGPAVGQDWFETILARDMGLLDPSRTVVALGLLRLRLDGRGRQGSGQGGGRDLLRRDPDRPRCQRRRKPRRRRPQPDLPVHGRRRPPPHRLVPRRRDLLQRAEDRPALPSAGLRPVADGRRRPVDVAVHEAAVGFGAGQPTWRRSYPASGSTSMDRAKSCTSPPLRPPARGP